MELIIDATILFCGLIGKGITKTMIYSDFVKLYSPESLIKEIEAHKSRIKLLSGLSATEFDLLLKRLKERIKVCPLFVYESFLFKANSQISDKGDTEYLALSLAFDKMPIWSNDPHFKEQSLVEVFNTKELVDKLKSLGFRF